MPLTHRVSEGECMVSIAARYGMPWQKIYNHPDNAELKQQRPDPNLLYAGDLVAIPEKDDGVVSAASDRRHRFKRLQHRAKIHLKLLTDPREEHPAPESAPEPGVYADPEPQAPRREPLKDVAYCLRVDGDIVAEGSTGASGEIEVEVSPNAAAAILVLEPNTERERTINLNLGHMDPLEKPRGVAKRLRNLGYPAPDVDSDGDAALAAALAGFQRDQGLEATGRLDAGTRSRLQEVHGG